MAHEEDMRVNRGSSSIIRPASRHEGLKGRVGARVYCLCEIKMADEIIRPGMKVYRVIALPVRNKNGT